MTLYQFCKLLAWYLIAAFLAMLIVQRHECLPVTAPVKVQELRA